MAYLLFLFIINRMEALGTLAGLVFASVRCGLSSTQIGQCISFAAAITIVFMPFDIFVLVPGEAY
jgi:hypothetical protein